MESSQYYQSYHMLAIGSVMFSNIINRIICWQCSFFKHYQSHHMLATMHVFSQSPRIGDNRLRRQTER